MSKDELRGRYNPVWRHAGIAAIDMAMAGGWAASSSYRLGLHGRLRVGEHDVRLPHEVLRTPLVLAFASDFHAGQTTHPSAHLPSCEITIFGPITFRFSKICKTPV